MSSKSLKYILFASVITTVSAFAAPPNTPVLDGRPLEYDATELRGSSTNQSNNFGPGNVITNLFVTWDADYIYFTLQGAENDNKLAIMIDADPGLGTGSSTTTNWSDATTNTPSHIRFNDVGWQVPTNGSATDFGLDYMVASEGFFNNAIRVLYDGIAAPDTGNVISLFDNGNGNNPQGGPVDVVVQADGTANDLKGLESRIAWSSFYIDSGRFGDVSGSVVPTGAVIRVFGVLHNNNPETAHSTDGIIPAQSSVLSSYAGFVWTTDDYIDIVIDGDSNGIPDVAVGDSNPPFLKFVSGVQSNARVFAWFNEDVESNTAEVASNWLVDDQIPESVTILSSSTMYLNLSNGLPAAGSLVRVQASGVDDADSNAKTTYNYFETSDSGTTNDITVRFVLNKNSGMGAAGSNPRVTTNLFINGGTAPLEFGNTPEMSSPLTMDTSSIYFREVTFPEGSSTEVFYKYSGILDGGSEATGTNNYEGIRAANFLDAARKITLPTDGTTYLVVTDYLGAAAGPYNASSNGYETFYFDSRRGDAGVRQDTALLFTLDLSDRNLSGVDRVMILGANPLRGFNNAADFWPADWTDFPLNEPGVTWENGGLEMLDDGLNGDAVAGDGIYTLQWSATTDGFDSFGDALVDGDGSVDPYFGSWFSQRSPRSFKYKFWVYKSETLEALETQAGDIEVYLEDPTETNIVFDTYLWDNDALPLPPPSNSPTMLGVSYTGGTGSGTFENDITELQHGYQVSTDLADGWLDFGGRAVTTGVSGVWSFSTENAQDYEHYRAFAGPAKPFAGVWADPYPIPETGATVGIYYTQHSRGLAGDRNIQIAGNFTSWTPQPMSFLGDGVWYYDLVANTSVFPNTEIKFKPRNLDGTFWDGMGGGGDDFFLYVGDLRASFSNNHPTNGELFTITYDAFGGPLSASTTLNAYVGFDEQWNDAGPRPMTNTLGQTNIWELSFAVPETTTLSINMVFNDGTTWDSESAAPPNGRQWRVFLEKGE